MDDLNALTRIAETWTCEPPHPSISLVHAVRDLILERLPAPLLNHETFDRVGRSVCRTLADSGVGRDDRKAVEGAIDAAVKAVRFQLFSALRRALNDRQTLVDALGIDQDEAWRTLWARLTTETLGRLSRAKGEPARAEISLYIVLKGLVDDYLRPVREAAVHVIFQVFAVRISSPQYDTTLEKVKEYVLVQLDLDEKRLLEIYGGLFGAVRQLMREFLTDRRRRGRADDRKEGPGPA